MLKKNKIDIKVVSKDVAYWTTVVKNLKNEIENSENRLKYDSACLVMAEEKLKIATSEDK